MKTSENVLNERRTGSERAPVDKQASIDEVIVSDTFIPTGKHLGDGAWGSVSLYRGPGDQMWALKIFAPNEDGRRQMEERGWTEEDVMMREAIPIGAASYNVTPRIIQTDKNGKMFVAMPAYDCDLSKVLHTLTLRESLGVAKNIATALTYFHNRRVNGNRFYDAKDKKNQGNGNAHGDVKPSNVLLNITYDEDGRRQQIRADLSDLGSTTCISIGGSGKKRGPHGDVNYRPPECSDGDASPSTRADVWGLGAILYEALTGESIYNGIDRDNTDQFKLNSRIKKKIRKVPWRLRSFLRKCLAVNEFERFRSGDEALKSLDQVIDNLDTKKVVNTHFKKWWPLGIPLALTGLLIYGAVTHEPKRLEMPRTNIQGMVYPPEKPGEEQRIEFEKETIDDLPSAANDELVFRGIIQNAKLSTNNRIVAYLLKAYAQAHSSRNTMRPPGAYTDTQFSTYIAYTTHDERQFAGLSGTPWPVWAKSIEVALNQAKTADGKVDLEDVMTISRVGVDLVNQAKRASGSFDYEGYRTAKDSKGKYIISEKEQSFINTWLAYYNADID